MPLSEDFFSRVFERVDMNNVIGQAVGRNATAILDLNRSQLWDGKGTDGEDLSPNYLEDPFFKTREQAIGYAKWKQAITRNPNRNLFAPNLFINGFYYKSLRLTLAPEAFEIVAGNSFSMKIEQKYDAAEGLTEKNIEEAGRIILDDVREIFSNEIKR